MKRPPVRSWSQVALLREFLSTHHRVSERLRETVQESTGLSVMEFDMLAELGGRSGMRMGDLSKKMITSPSSTTRIAKSLEAKGYVERSRDPESERVVIAQLTQSGHSFFDKHFRRTAAIIAADMDACLSEREQKTLTRLLQKMGSAPA